MENTVQMDGMHSENNIRTITRHASTTFFILFEDAGQTQSTQPLLDGTSANDALIESICSQKFY